VQWLKAAFVSRSKCATEFELTAETCKMRQLKGGKQKETAKEKRQRKKEVEEVQKQIKTVVVPALIVAFIMIVAYVYSKTRPTNYNME
jgi:hypothetical protein